eukprot:Rmarinus@m.11159
MAGADVSLPPISNYKGVMLCDRPSAPNAAKSAGPKPFLSAVMPVEQLGLNPPKMVHHAALIESVKTKPSYLDRHKQWLSEFARFKQQKKREAEVQKDREEQKKKQFDEYSKRLRDAIRNGTEDVDFLLPRAAPCASGNGGGGKTVCPGPGEVGQRLLEDVLGSSDIGISVAPRSPPTRKSARDGSSPDRKETIQRPSSAPRERAPDRPVVEKPKPKKSRKDRELAAMPAWALTEEKVAERDELREAQEVDDLLDFVSDLNYEAYVEDFEVRQALEVVRQRVEELQDGPMSARVHDVDADGQDCGADDNRGSATASGARGLRVAVDGEDLGGRENWDSSTKVDRPATGMSVREAERILANHKKLRGIHSLQSLNTIMENTMKGDPSQYSSSTKQQSGPLQPTQAGQSGKKRDSRTKPALPLQEPCRLGDKPAKTKTEESE